MKKCLTTPTQIVGSAVKSRFVLRVRFGGNRKFSASKTASPSSKKGYFTPKNLGPFLY